MGVCETLMPDVVSSNVHQNNCNLLCELSGPTFGFTTREFSMVGGYMHGDPWKTTKLLKLGGGRLHGYGRLLGTMWYLSEHLLLK